MTNDFLWHLAPVAGLAGLLLGALALVVAVLRHTPGVPAQVRTCPACGHTCGHERKENVS